MFYIWGMQITRLLTILLLVSCTGNRGKKLDNSNDVSCVNAFVRSLYDGRFDDAETIMVPDAAGAECLKQARFNYNQHMNRATKIRYKNAAVLIKKEPLVNDSIVIFICTDPITEKNKPFKTVRRNNQWLIEFSYTCSGNL
jgi:hypothetical protein